jgi:hypothetical protein
MQEILPVKFSLLLSIARIDVAGEDYNYMANEKER